MERKTRALRQLSWRLIGLSQTGFLAEHGFDALYVLGVVQFPEHPPPRIDLDAFHMRAVFEKAQLFQPFVAL